MTDLLHVKINSSDLTCVTKVLENKVELTR
jgi:hypothetical protein